MLRPKRAKRVGPVAVAFPVADEAPKGREDDEHGPSSDEEARAVAEQASAASAGTKRKAEEAQEEAQTGTKRTSEEAQREAQTSTKRTHEEAQREAQTSTKRTHEEANLDDNNQAMSIRRVETVDAEWYTVRTLAVPESDVAHLAVEDPEGNDQHDKHIVTGDADQPPTLEAHVLRDYDDQAEVEEIERLIQMGVLVEPVPGEEAEVLSTTFATIWKGDKGTWWRRARLYRWATDMEAEDTFSPASIGSLLRHIVVLAQTWGTPIWVCDVKDAYLNVEQPKDAPVVVDAPLSYARRYGPKRWKLGRILPGQRRGAQEWFLHLNVDLEAQGLEAMIEVPTLYRATSPKERKAAQVHVDDAMLTGDQETVNPLLANLREKYTIKVNGPFYPGDEFEFLKCRFRIEADGSITVRAAAHFYLDIYNLLGEPRLRNTPGPVGDLFMVDDSKALGPTDGTLFRTLVGKLLYIAAERPDVQVVIQFLASKAAAPTEGALRVLKHLAGFMKATEGHGVNLKAAKGASIMNFGAHDVYSQHVVEAVSDSNFATDRATRKSLSSGHVYIDRCLMFSFVPSQKVVTLSSGEAELVALTQTVGESILIHKAWEFLTRATADHVARSDSSVARAIASRLGVGRVKHLQTSSLWIQQWVHRKELRVAAIGTALNPTDMGTKILSANRLRMLCAVAGMVDDGGNKVGKEELQAELYKTKGVNAKTLHLVQLLMASTLQGCSVENYEDTLAVLPGARRHLLRRAPHLLRVLCRGRVAPDHGVLVLPERCAVETEFPHWARPQDRA